MLVYPVPIIDVLMHRLAMMVQDVGNNDVLPVRVAAEVADVRRSQNSDSEAYRRLIEAHQEYVGQLLWRFSRDKAVREELVQDVFVEAYFSLHSYKGKAPFSHWLARIATRVGYRYWKKADAHTGELTFEEWDRVAAANDHDDMPEAAELLYRLLGQLPPRDRLVLTLRYIDDCDVAEVAQRTGWTKTMVKVQTLRAKMKLKKLFDQKQKER
ncbi:MAG: RNA polymerase sigma factor [Sedimentisphaerales bacterium]|nr:RNA polymerase sigma factor [Sedimentisphaerales bacterium]